VLGVLVARTGLVIDTAPHVVTDERRVCPACDALGGQECGVPTGLWIVSGANGFRREQLADGRCGDDSSALVVPILAALDDVLVGKQSHWSSPS
jgi:hypothetical protein